MNPITKIAAIGTLGWVFKKLLGPTLEEMGDDFKNLYIKGVSRIVNNASKKTKNIDEQGRTNLRVTHDVFYRKGADRIVNIVNNASKKTKNIDEQGQTNLRVTRDVFYNGAFADEEICAEYFGGILAASRSADGKDDSGVFYLDIIKSLSSCQLKMHYIIYRTLNKAFIANVQKKSVKPQHGLEIKSGKLFFPLQGTIEQFHTNDLSIVLHGLFSKNLIDSFKPGDVELGNNRAMPYLEVSPTPLGVQLFAIANNKINEWQKFSIVDFGDFDHIILPQHFAQSREALLEKTRLKEKSG